MFVFVRRTIVACCLLLVAGCVTEELVVYKENVVAKKAMKPFLGTYKVEKWIADKKPESVRVTEKDGEFSFSFEQSDKKIRMKFVLSKIPNSKQGLYLLSLPSQKDTKRANIFFIGKAEKEQTQIWAVFPNSPVANEHLKFQGFKAKVVDVKKFLAKHADAFVTENKPHATLKKNTER